MCGITGTYYFDKELPESQVNALKASLDQLNHRGPDFQGSYELGSYACAHARLAIIAPNPKANQPFLSEDGRYSLCFNGEIYNFKELKKELETNGLHFKTESDTEVLLYWLIEHGKLGLKNLNGFFAFAFFDRDEHSLLIAKDRMGQKPLYYHSHADGIQYSSELRPIRPYLNKLTPDFQALGLYLQLGYFPAPYTALEKVKKLEPGHLLEVKNGKISKECWFEMPCERTKKESSEAELNDCLIKAVEMRMVADRPLGTFLSGGIDSSIVTMIASEFKADLDTFSIGFNETAYLDETKMAAKVAKELGVHHHRIAFEDHKPSRILQEYLEKLDEPFADSSAIAYYLISQFASQQVKVALTGDGADELFGGYRKHRAHLMLNNPLLNLALRLISPKKGNRENSKADRQRKLGKLATAARMKPRERYWFMATFSHIDPNAALNAKVYNDSLRDEYLKYVSDNRLSSVLCADQHLVLPDDMLHKADRMSMRHGLEVRSPFMDPAVVELASTFRSHELLNYRKGKLPLRKTFKHDLPKELWDQPKKGFEIPLQSLLLGEWRPMIETVLMDNSTERTQVFEQDFILAVWQEFCARPDAESAFLVWALFLAKHWYRDLL